MPWIERVSGSIKEAEVHKDSPEELERYVTLITRQVEYGSTSHGERRNAYTYLRHLADSVKDRHIQHTIQNCFQERWQRIGFFTRIQKDISQGAYRAYHAKTELDTDTKIAILELAHKRQESRRKQPIDHTQFADSLTGLLGYELDYEELTGKLKDIVLLNGNAEFVPLITREEGINLTNEAYKLLVSHLEILNIISYPENTEKREERKLAGYVKRKTDEILTRTANFFQSDILQAITIISKQPFGRNLKGLETEIEKKNLPVQENQPAKAISFIAESGLLYKFGRTTVGKSKIVEMGIYKLHPLAKQQLTYDFFGQQLKGKEIGKIQITRESDGETLVEIDGVMKSVLPENLRNPDSISISAHGLKLNWNDVAKGKKIDMQVAYQSTSDTNMQKDIDKEGILITANPALLYVPEKNSQNHAQIPVKYRQVPFARTDEQVDIVHTSGKYTVRYKKEKGGGIQVRISSRSDHSKDTIYVLPARIDIIHIMDAIDTCFSTWMENITKQKEAIRKQTETIKHLTLSEQIGLEQVNLTGKFNNTDVLEQDFGKFDATTSYYTKYYIKTLMELTKREMNPSEKEKTIAEVKKKMRSLIKGHKLPISEKFLKNSEQILLV